jgi:hypothetical protein
MAQTEEGHPPEEAHESGEVEGDEGTEDAVHGAMMDWQNGNATPVNGSAPAEERGTMDDVDLEKCGTEYVVEIGVEGSNPFVGPALDADHAVEQVKEQLEEQLDLPEWISLNAHFVVKKEDYIR